MSSLEEKVSDLQDRLDRLQFFRGQALEQHVSHRNTARSLSKTDPEYERERVIANIYFHIQIIHNAIADTIATLNEMHTAMLALPDTRDFKEMKRKVNRIVKKKRAPTKKEMQDYEKDNRGRAVYK